MKFSIIIALLLLFALIVHAQEEPLAVLWTKTYGGENHEYNWALIELEDNGFLLGGHSLSFGPGGWDVWLVRTDSDGEMIWNRAYGSGDTDYCKSLLQDNDGNFVAVGDFRNGDNGWDYWMSKYEQNGDVIWGQVYGDDGEEGSRLRGSVIETREGGFVLVGHSESFGAGDEDLFIVRTDEDGDVIWQSTFGDAEDNGGRAVVETEDGGFAVAGWTWNQEPEGNDDAWLVKVDGDGNFEWDSIFNWDDDDSFQAILDLGDGFALAGGTSSFGDEFDMLLIRTDEEGELLWFQTYGGESSDYCRNMIRTAEGGFALVGYTNSIGAGAQDMWLVVTDDEGEELWSETYGGFDDELCNTIVCTADDGFALGGWTKSFVEDEGMADYWLVKLGYRFPRLVPDDYETIQEAIDAAQSGDTVLVAPGQYVENIDFSGKNLTIASMYLITGDETYIDSTIIEGGRNGSSTITFSGNETEEAIITGFTIRNGRAGVGGGIFLSEASPQIRHCIITENISNLCGGGIYCWLSSPLIINCTISANSAESGGAVYCENESNPIIVNSIIYNNGADEIHFSGNYNPNRITVSFSLIEDGVDGIVMNNNGEIRWQEGNIALNPMFIEPEDSDFHLTWANFPVDDETKSPCIDTGNPEYPEDPDSSRNDMGALYFNQLLPVISVIPEALEFDYVEPYNFRRLEVTIRNIGQNTLEVISQSITPGGGSFAVVQGGGAFGLEPDSTHLTWILFAPVDTARYNATLLIESNALNARVFEIPITGSSMEITQEEISLPGDFSLTKAYPNPFNSSVILNYSLPRSGKIRLAIFNLSGCEIAMLKEDYFQPGRYSIMVEASDWPAGIYFVRLEMSMEVRIKKLVCVK